MLTSDPEPISPLKPVLVSGCALGFNCRWNCKAVQTNLDLEPGSLPLPVCPETLAGFGCPRPSIQLSGGDGELVLRGRARALEESGEDITQQLIKACERVASFCKDHGVKTAYLVENSPSCGVNRVWVDGQLVSGKGVLTALLRGQGLEVVAVEKGS